MDMLEREMGYKEELFDFIQQYLRTILLKRISLPPVITDNRRCFTPLPLSRSSSIPFITLNTPLPYILPAIINPRPAIRRTPQTQCCG